MSKKSFLAAAVGVLLVLAVSACGHRESGDEFADATLRQATRGKIVSKGFKYEFHNPRVAALSNTIGIIREGNLLEFIGGRNLEERLNGLEGTDYSLGVVKEFSPFVHFRVERIFTETDTVFLAQAGAIDYPSVTTEDAFDRGGFAEYNLSRIPYDRTDMIEKLLAGAYYIETHIVREEENGSPVYLLVADRNKFRIVDAADGTAAILELLAKGGYPFEGGITLAAIEPLEVRRSTGIIGEIRVDFVKYGRMVISG